MEVGVNTNYMLLFVQQILPTKLSVIIIYHPIS